MRLVNNFNIRINTYSFNNPFVIFKNTKPWNCNVSTIIKPCISTYTN